MTEQLDVLDDSGRPTGWTKSKAEIMLHGDWRKVVHIWIVDDEARLLIQQRAQRGGIFDDLWDVSVGGGVRTGEPSSRAAQRELREELGLRLPAGDFRLLGTWKIPPKTVDDRRLMKDFSDTFLVRVHSVDMDKLTLQRSEVQAVDLISLDELLRRVQDPEIYKGWVPHGAAYYLEVAASIRALMAEETNS